MTRFLKQLLRFFSPLVIGSFALQLFISYNTRKISIWGHDNLQYNSNTDADLIMIGSSRTWAHFNPAFFDSQYNIKSVNIGVDGHSELSMTILRLLIHLKTNAAPKIAVLNFDPFVTGGSFSDNNNFVHKPEFSRYAFFPDKNYKLIVDYFKFDMSEKYIPLFALIKYKRFTSSLFPKNINNYIHYGYEKHEESWDTIANPPSDLMKTNFFKSQDLKAIHENLNILNTICKDNNILLICVQTPVYKTLYEQAYFLQPKLICERLSIPFFDMNTSKIVNDVDFFYNSNHLNDKGVNEMNKILSQNDLFNTIIKTKLAK